MLYYQCRVIKNPSEEETNKLKKLSLQKQQSAEIKIKVFKKKVSGFMSRKS